MSTTIEIWPAFGTTVTLAGGYVVTAAGAVAVWPNDEISGLLAATKLLTADPTSLHPNPSPIPPINTGGGLTAPTMAALAYVPTILPGTLCEVLGFYATNDGGGGTFYADIGSSSAAVAGMCVAALGGRWKRLCDASALRVKWFGAYGDGTHDDTAAIQLALDTVSASTGGSVCLDYTSSGYRITNTLKCGQGSGANVGNAIRIFGEGPTGGVLGHPVLFWDSASSTAPLLWCCGFDFSFHNFGIQAITGRTLYSGIEVGNFAAAPVYFTSQARFEGITISSDSASRAITNGVTIGSKFGQDGNLERMFFESCTFEGIVNNCVWLGSGQPFNTSFIRCLFYALYSMPHGRALQCDTPSATSHFTDCDFEGLEQCILLTRNANVTVTAGQSELCHTFFYFYGPFGVIPGCLTIRNLRMSNINVDNTAVWIYVNGLQSVILEGNTMCDTDKGFMMVSGDVPVISRGNIWPNLSFLQSRVAPVAGITIGGVWSEGDSYYVTPTTFAALPTLKGSWNGPATATISGAATSVTVSLPYNEWGVDYDVDCQLVSVTGTPASGSLTAYATSLSPIALTLTVPVAPGVGNSVTYRYTLSR